MTEPFHCLLGYLATEGCRHSANRLFAEALSKANTAEELAALVRGIPDKKLIDWPSHMGLLAPKLKSLLPFMQMKKEERQVLGEVRAVLVEQMIIHPDTPGLLFWLSSRLSNLGSH